MNMVRYADDFIITGHSKEWLENEVQPAVVEFLAERGLILSPEKTTITHIKDGFDFLGWNIRKYNGNTLPITVQPVSGGPTSQGTLSFLDNAVDTTTGTILLKGRFDNTDATLWPGEFVNAALQLYVQQDALVAPGPAVVQSQTGTYVFVVKGGTATQREVKVQRMAGNDAIIASGVAAGDTIVTDGQLRLVTGLKVQIKAPPGTDQPRS